MYMYVVLYVCVHMLFTFSLLLKYMLRAVTLTVTVTVTITFLPIYAQVMRPGTAFSDDLKFLCKLRPSPLEVSTLKCVHTLSFECMCANKYIRMPPCDPPQKRLAAKNCDFVLHHRTT